MSTGGREGGVEDVEVEQLGGGGDGGVEGAGCVGLKREWGVGG